MVRQNRSVGVLIEELAGVLLEHHRGVEVQGAHLRGHV